MPAFQYISDLHIEFYDENNMQFDIDPVAEYLLLAGDVGNPFLQSYKLFLENVSNKFNKIFIIAGNHEYYNHAIEETDTQCRSVCSLFNNVIFLQNESYVISNKLVVYGTTLWSHVPAEYTKEIFNKINDYKFIKNFTVSINNSLHKNAITALINEIKSSEYDYIVVSHHLPSLDLISEKYKHFTILNHAFASSIDSIDIVKCEKIKAWVYGHTHEANQINKFYCNPVGYPNENKYWSMYATFAI